LNGYEIGGGSLRITDPDILIKVFEVLGYNKKDIEEKFGHLISAFSYGVPPHGGIAPGVDRILMILENEPNIREVIAFPKTGEGRDYMMDAPSEVSQEQLKELKLKVETENKK
jgi:aspartyl-tRNA synthetase